MTVENLQAFLIGLGCGICVGVGAMLHWHLGRVRELWHGWISQR